MVGYCLAHDAWGEGYATEVCKRMMDLAKGYGVHELIRPVYLKNTASCRVLHKCGFQEDTEAEECMYLPNLCGGRGACVRLKIYRLFLSA
mmetsp:Transcript_23764/g.70263  ORF Transcript_23764/g.70263 Transcript_23764/m.70263 type:complete len:90 (+) Transcript_23764:410-679(+)